MTTTEKIAESYFRTCKGCFTIPDVKVLRGNNRQLDLLAVNCVTGDQYHAEVSVSHRRRFLPTLEKLEWKYEYKFFGGPRRRSSPRSDSARGKSYRGAIEKTYRRFGLDPDRIRRIWICWDVKLGADESLHDFSRNLADRFDVPESSIEIWTFRQTILPELYNSVRTANYQDDVLRVLSLLKQLGKQNK